MATRWSERARASAPRRFDPSALLAVPERQRAVEGACGATLEEVTAPTADAVSAAFAYTAVLAGRPDNAPPPAAAGAAFGRLAHCSTPSTTSPTTVAAAGGTVDATGAGVEATTAPARHQVAALGAALPRVVLPDPAGVDARLADARARPDGAAAHRPAAAARRPGTGPPAPWVRRRVRRRRGAVLHRPALLRRPDHRTVERPAAPRPLRELLRLLVVQL